VAIKVIKHDSDSYDRKLLDKEIKAMQKINNCRGCIQLLGVFEDTSALYLVEELATGGELLERILEMGSFTEDIAACLIRQVLEGLAEIHAHGVVHRYAYEDECFVLLHDSATNALIMLGVARRRRDLKPENILMLSGFATGGLCNG
jgi:serine/threonine protein kinase